MNCVVLFDENANEVKSDKMFLLLTRKFSTVCGWTFLIFQQVIVSGLSGQVEQWKKANIIPWKTVVAVKGARYKTSSYDQERNSYTVNCVAFEDTIIQVIVFIRHFLPPVF